MLLTGSPSNPRKDVSQNAVLWGPREILLAGADLIIIVFPT